MDVIHRSAYFRVCKECYQHAVIVFTNGTKVTIYSKEQALVVVGEAFKEGLLKEDECPELLRQIEESVFDEIALFAEIFVIEVELEEVETDDLPCTHRN